MLILDGAGDYALVLDGNWVEKVVCGQSQLRILVTQYTSTTVTGEDSMFVKKGRLSVQLQLGPATVTLDVDAARRAEVDAFAAALERAKAAALAPEPF